MTQVMVDFLMESAVTANVGARVASLRGSILRSDKCNLKPDLWRQHQSYTQVLTRALPPQREQRVAVRLGRIGFGCELSTFCLLASLSNGMTVKSSGSEVMFPLLVTRQRGELTPLGYAS